jgi:beta-ureidopropionase / N-carbamoyl-L-amino-acid hydrolase
MEDLAERAAGAVREDRLWRRHMEMARIGGLAKGGVNRQALSQEDARSRALLQAWAGARGFAVSSDAIGNLFVRRPGTDQSARPVVTGSHMDSQPTGGKFNGMYGVLAGLEVLEALEDSGTTTKRPLEVVAWMNEEGSRFQPGCMGSGVFAGLYTLDAMLAEKDRQGVSVRDALAETLAAALVPMRDGSGQQMDGYVEAHIEQGPRLEEAGTTIGVVTGIQGSRRYEIDIVGEEAHAGTTPRAVRKDAFVTAVALSADLQRATADDADTVRFTIGRFEVRPGSPNTVPGHVHFTIDLRHPELSVLEDIDRHIHEIAARHDGRCKITVKRITDVAPTVFNQAVIDLVRESAQRLGFSAMEMPSGAGHDAMHIARLCPTGMIFVPCARGVSHNEAESATPADLAAGARVLAASLVALANR